MLNDLSILLSLAARSRAAVALDCVSSLGAVRLPEASESLLLVSSVSGKSLGAYSGLAFVYMAQRCKRMLSARTLCPSFDLLRMQATRGPVSTVPSSTLLALLQALRDSYQSPEAAARRFFRYAEVGRFVRHELRALGLRPIASEMAAAPTVTSFVLPHSRFADDCKAAGFEIAHESAYLQARQLGQIATMGDVYEATLAPLFLALRSSSRSSR